MRFLPGITVALCFVVALLVVRGCSDVPTVPPDDFLRLELVGPPPDSQSSCFSLQATMVATRFLESHGVVAWTPVYVNAAGQPKRRHYWWDSLRLRKPVAAYWDWKSDSVKQSANGPVNDWRVLRFEEIGGSVHLVSVQSSAGTDLSVQQAFEELVAAPRTTGAKRVARCAAG
jgi:hypothetical protein